MRYGNEEPYQMFQFERRMKNENSQNAPVIRKRYRQCLVY